MALKLKKGGLMMGIQKEPHHVNFFTPQIKLTWCKSWMVWITFYCMSQFSC